MPGSRSIQRFWTSFCMCVQAQASLAESRRIQSHVERILKANLEAHQFHIQEGGVTERAFQTIVKIPYAAANFAILDKSLTLKGLLTWQPSARLFIRHIANLRDIVSKEKESKEGLKMIADYEKRFLSQIERGVKAKSGPRLEFAVTRASKTGAKLSDWVAENKFLGELIASFAALEKRCRLRACMSFVFHAQEYRLAGGLSVPFRLKYDREAFESVGKPSVSGLGLSFEDSPVGLKSVDISSSKDMIDISTELEYVTLPSRDLLLAAFEHSADAAALFVEEREETA